MYQTPQINFLEMFLAAQNARQQRDQFAMQKERHEMELEQYKTQKENQKALGQAVANDSLADVYRYGGAEMGMKYEAAKRDRITFEQGQQQAAQAQMQQDSQRRAAAFGPGGYDRERLAANVKRMMASAKTPEARAAAEQKAFELTQRGLIDPFETTGAPPSPESDLVPTSPQRASMIQHQLKNEGDAALSAYAAARPEDKPTSEMIEYASISKLRPDDPNWGPGFAEYQRKMAEARAIKVPSALEGGARAKLQDQIVANDILLGNLDEIESLGDPSQFVGAGNALKNFTLSKIASIAPDSLTPESREQLIKARQFQEGVESIYLQSKNAITGASGSEKELADIRRAVLNSDMSGPEFVASFEKLKRATRRNSQIMKNMLADGIDLGTASGKLALDREIQKVRATENKAQQNNNGGGKEPVNLDAEILKALGGAK